MLYHNNYKGTTRRKFLGFIIEFMVFIPMFTCSKGWEWCNQTSPSYIVHETCICLLSYTYMYANANLMQLHRYLDFSHSLIAFASFSDWIWSTKSHSQSINHRKVMLTNVFSHKLKIGMWPWLWTWRTSPKSKEAEAAQCFSVLHKVWSCLKDYVSYIKTNAN